MFRLLGDCLFGIRFCEGRHDLAAFALQLEVSFSSDLKGSSHNVLGTKFFCSLSGFFRRTTQRSDALGREACIVWLLAGLAKLGYQCLHNLAVVGTL